MAKQPHNARARKQAPGPLRILLIENDADQREGFTRLLRGVAPGAHLMEATDARSGIEHFERHPFDLVFIDDRLPDLDGREALRRLLAHDPLATVVALTDQGDRQLAIEMIGGGAIDYLEKERLSEYALAQAIDFAGVRRRSEAKFRLLVSKHHAPIVVLDEKHEVQYANSAALEFFAWHEGTESPRRLELPSESEVLEWSTGSGESRFAEVHEQEMEWESSPCRLVTLRDVTALREANQRLQGAVDRLERTNTRLDRFASTLSHDLREPLRAINSFTKILAERYLEEGDEEGRELFEFVVQGGERMGDLISSVLEFARSGAATMTLEDVDTDEVLAHVLLELEPLAEELQAEVTVRSMPRVRADRGALRRIFQNLVANGLKYHGTRPPRVEVWATTDPDGTVTFAVSDNGRGIATENHEAVFDSFFRLHQASEIKGSGLGLDICRTLVEHHGGTIWLESQLGEGTSFFFNLPRAALRIGEPRANTRSSQRASATQQRGAPNAPPRPTPSDA